MEIETDYISEKYKVGSIHSNSYGPIKILGRNKYKPSEYRIEFLNTGSTRFALSGNIKNDNVKDYYQPNTFGVGYLGDFEKVPKSKLHRRLYLLWSNMLLRCYGTTYNNSGTVSYTYTDVTVCPRWLNYSNFFFSVQEVKGFDLWLKGNEEYHLDKDKSGSRYYSPETCEFIDRKENMDLAHLKQRVVAKQAWVVYVDGTLTFVRDYIKFAEHTGLKAYEVLKLLNGTHKKCKGYMLADGTTMYTFLVGGVEYNCIQFTELATKYNTMTSVFWKLVSGKRNRYKDVKFIRSEVIKVSDLEQNE